MFDTEPTPRVQRLLAALNGFMFRGGRRVSRVVLSPQEYLEKEELRVASFRETVNLPMISRRALALQHLTEYLSPVIAEDELIVGSQRGNLGWFLPTLGTPEQLQRQARIHEAYRELGIGFGEGHVVVDYAKVLNEGFGGIHEEAFRSLLDPDLAWSQRTFLHEVETVCVAAHRFALRHSELAEELGAQADNPRRQEELRQIAEICSRVPWVPARNFHEALQSLWFTHVLLHLESPSVAYSLGRMDQYLWPFYQRDLSDGRLTREQAQELLDCLFIKLCEGEESQNIVVGGIHRDGSDATNELSHALLDTVGRLRVFQPTVSARLRKHSPESFVRKAAELATAGIGQPSFFNDEVVIEALKWIGVAEEDARDYAIVGCYEATVPGKENGRTVAACISLPHAVLRALARAVSTDSFEAFMGLVREEIQAGIDQGAADAADGDWHLADKAPSPLLSALVQDCIASATDLYSGGAVYNYTGCFATGLATAVDSVAAIREAVFRSGRFTLTELKALVDTDFANAEEERLAFLNRTPKYGNDDEEADALARELSEFFCKEVVRHRNLRGGICQPGLNSFNNHFLGCTTGATPDGRRASQPFSCGIGPAPGRNREGLTSVLHSAAKLSHRHAPNGDSLDLSLGTDAVKGEAGLKRVAEIVRTYFDLGGFQAQINVVDAATLRAAREDPESYRDLIVRVAGFSAHFVALGPEIQDSLIARAEAGL